jgi:hypothetical protein
MTVLARSWWHSTTRRAKHFGESVLSWGYVPKVHSDDPDARMNAVVDPRLSAPTRRSTMLVALPPQIVSLSLITRVRKSETGGVRYGLPPKFA